MAVQPSDARRPALTEADPELAALVDAEERLQADTLRLIPSENYVSAAVLEASGTVLQNKYSEGYPGKRYYEGRSVRPPQALRPVRHPYRHARPDVPGDPRLGDGGGRAVDRFRGRCRSYR